MASDLRTGIDTNVAVSAALLSRSIPRHAFDAAAGRGRLLISEATVVELEEVLRRPKFDKYVPEKTRLEFLSALVRDAELVEITETVQECRDPTDDKFLEVAVNGRATHIVSGDPDLLALNPFRQIAVVTPKDFLALIPPEP
jgi:putative PIN family toxin of toxin-antitoxin system